MQKFQNLPSKFPVQNLSKFTFGLPDGKDDPILDACALKISPVAEFLEENKSILVGDRGTGKTAVFRLLSEGKLKFNNPNEIEQIYIPIDEDLAYKTLRQHIVHQIKDVTNGEMSSHRIVWELFIFSRCLDCLDKKIKKNVKFESLQKDFYSVVGWDSQKKIGFLDILNNTKKSFGVKLEGGHMGYIIPNFYASIEPKISDDNAFANKNFLDLQNFKSRLNAILLEGKSVAYVLIDKLDEFVSGVDYQIQLDTLQALIHCWRDYQGYQKIKIKLFLRKDLYERLDFSAIGKDKIDPRKVDLKWTDEEIRQLIASRLFHNLSPIIKGKSIKLELNAKQLTINKEFLREIRTLDAIPGSELSFVKRCKKFLILLRAKFSDRKRDEYDARTTNIHDVVSRAIITILFPRSTNHKNKANKNEIIEFSEFLGSHFSYANGNTTPRVILLYLQKCLEIARNYYRSNPEEHILINEKSEYPVFLREHLSEAYDEVRLLALQTVLGLNYQWSRSATILMQAIARSKTPNSISFRDAKKAIGTSIGEDEAKDLTNFFAFYEHAGLFRCVNRTQILEARKYELPILFQRVNIVMA